MQTFKPHIIQASFRAADIHPLNPNREEFRKKTAFGALFGNSEKDDENVLLQELYPEGLVVDDEPNQQRQEKV